MAFQAVGQTAQQKQFDKVYQQAETLGSLVHIDPLGKRDAPIPDEVRIYTFGGCQHGPGSGVAGARGNGQLPGNPSDYRPLWLTHSVE